MTGRLIIVKLFCGHRFADTVVSSDEHVTRYLDERF